MRILKVSERAKIMKRAGLLGLSPKEQQERRMEKSFREKLLKAHKKEGT